MRLRRRRSTAAWRSALERTIASARHLGVGPNAAADTAGPEGDVQMEVDVLLAFLTGMLSRNHSDLDVARGAEMARSSLAEVHTALASLDQPSGYRTEVTVFVERVEADLSALSAALDPLPWCR